MAADSTPKAFESGVAQYFIDFNHRLARETAHQAWLYASVAKLIDPQFLVAELNVPNQDISPFANITASRGGSGFDFAVTRSEIDLRTWKSRTPGWNSGIPTTPQTLETLQEVVVLAEFKIAESTSTNNSALIADLEKMRGVAGFLAHHGCTSFPSCYLVVFDPHKRLHPTQALQTIIPSWPSGAPIPSVLVGP